MAFRRFGELPWYLQTFLFFAVAVALFLAGEWFELSPVKGALDQRAALERQYQQLVAEVSRLQAVKQQHQAFRTRLRALEEQLARAQSFVPDEKKTDEFIRILQNSARNAQIAVRRLTARAVVFKEFYAEIPMEVELDGGYYQIKEFFQRLARNTRIINAGALQLKGIETGRGQYQYGPGTTVAGVGVITTYYTPSEAELAAAAPPGPAGARAGAAPGRR